MTQHEELEALVDRVGLRRTVEMLAEICRDKSEHIAVNWQDKRLADRWAAVSRKLDKVVPAADWMGA